MRANRIPTLALLTALISLPLVAQSAEQQKRFAGTWEAKFKGKVICTITLEVGENLRGSTQGCNIQVNSEGDLIETASAEQAGDPEPIVNTKVDADKLSFESKDGDDTLKFEFTLTASSRAELRFINAPMKIKPVPFERR